jgi:hypothetical protein
MCSHQTLCLCRSVAVIGVYLRLSVARICGRAGRANHVVQIDGQGYTANRRLMRLNLLAVVLSLVVAGSAEAQQLKIAFNQGHVSLDATSVPVRTILAEWSKSGGTKFVGAERVTGAPLTLKLVDVPESQALEIILRNVAGYMAAPRSAAGGTSMYDRILVLATSSAPAAGSSGSQARPTPGPGPTSGTQRFVPRPQVQDPVEEPEQPEEEPERPSPPVFTFPQPAGSNPQGIVMPPGSPSTPGNTTAPSTITINPAPPPANGGVGAVGAPAPGMIQTPTTQPGQPGQPQVRPPGK